MGGEERSMCLQTAPHRGETQKCWDSDKGPGRGLAQKNHMNKEKLMCYDLEPRSCFLSRGCRGHFGDEARELT